VCKAAVESWFTGPPSNGRPSNTHVRVRDGSATNAVAAPRAARTDRWLVTLGGGRGVAQDQPSANSRLCDPVFERRGRSAGDDSVRSDPPLAQRPRRRERRVDGGLLRGPLTGR